VYSTRAEAAAESIASPLFVETMSPQEELVQLYHFTAAGEHRDSTALGRLLEDVAETGARGRRAVSASAPAMRLRTRADDEGGMELVFEEIEVEEVEEEVEFEAAPTTRRREVVGR
jgi:hypothetical protein